MLDWHGSGMSVMEMSHRGKEFIGIAGKAEADLRTLLAIPDDYKVLFLQGGAIAENAIVPMNLLGGRKLADYVNTGEWSKKSIKEAKKYCTVNIAASAEDAQLHLRAGAGDLEAIARHRLRARVHERDDRRRRIPMDAGHRRRPAGGRHVVAHPVARHRRREVRRDLRRRAEERRSGRPHARDRPRRPPRSRAADHAVGVPLEGAGGSGFDGQHAADVRDLHRGPRVRVAAGAGRRAGDRATGTSRRPRSCTTISTRRASTRARRARRTGRG